MSRSWKKYPCVTDGSKRKTLTPMKRFANKKVRHSKEFSSRAKGFYKKLFCSYDICDFVFVATEKDLEENWYKEEIEYPKTQVYNVYRKNEAGEYYVAERRTVTVPIGPLHKKFGTFENYKNDWKKHYLRK